MTEQIPQFIQLLITGGTIDKDYQTTSGELLFSETHLPQILEEASCTVPVRTETLMLKDSLEMSDTDREVILGACCESRTQKIIITHGTDTMVETALKLSESENLQNKTIILTGAMRPFRLGRSDASFNMGSALMAVQLAQAGVYIVMNGQLFSAQQVQKDRQNGIFITA